MEDVRIVTIPPQTVLGIRKKGHYRKIAELLPEIAIYAMENNIAITCPPVFMCHERSKEAAMKADREGSADIEVGFPAAPGTRPGLRDEGIHPPLRQDGPDRSTWVATGPASHLKLYAWIGERRMKITGPIREIYHNDSREVTLEEIMTRILAPVE